MYERKGAPHTLQSESSSAQIIAIIRYSVRLQLNKENVEAKITDPLQHIETMASE